MSRRGLNFGIFLAPFHRLGENPTLGMARDLELIDWLDHLGYDEAWVGEHHSAGWETIAAPEIFIAAAAERTRHIRLGSGVTSLPYHNPFMVAQRFVQLYKLSSDSRPRLGQLLTTLVPNLLFELSLSALLQKSRNRLRPTVRARRHVVVVFFTFLLVRSSSVVCTGSSIIPRTIRTTHVMTHIHILHVVVHLMMRMLRCYGAR